MVDIITILAWTTALCVVLLTLLVLYTNKKHQFWAERGVPFVKPYPIVGNSLPFITGGKNFNQITIELYKSLEPHPFGGVMDFWRPSLFIRDPELLRQILVKDFDHFVDHVQFDRSKSNKWICAILTQLQGKEWKDVRTVMTPAFTSGKMKRMFPLVMNCCEQLVEFIEKENVNEKQPLEAKDLFSRLTMDVVASIAFGVECNSLKDKKAPFAEMGMKTQLVGKCRMMRFFMCGLFPKFAKLIGVQLFDKEAIDFFVDVVKSTIEYREKHSVKRNDFLQLLMDARSSDTEVTHEIHEDDSQDAYYADAKMNHKVSGKTVLSDDIIVSQCILFFLAGFDTTSNALQFIAYHLAVNPDIQEKLHDHIEKVIAEHDGKVNYDAIHHMPYLDMVVSETLRMFPAIPRNDRMCTERYQIPGSDVVLEKGQLIYIPTAALHMDEKYFPNPEKFDPERFSAENKTSIPPYVYQPFGHGPRNCIGNRFALMEINLAIVSLIRKYIIKTAPKMIVPMEPDTKSAFYKPKGGMWLDFKPRKV